MGSSIQKTGAPISKSRSVPPPIAVMSAKNQAAMKSRRLRAAANAPEAANTEIPAILSQATRFSVSKSIGPYSLATDWRHGLYVLDMRYEVSRIS